MWVGISASLLAVLGLMELLDMLVGAAGDKPNALMQTNLDRSLKGLLGYLFYPLALIMGVPSPSGYSRVILQSTLSPS